MCKLCIEEFKKLQAELGFSRTGLPGTLPGITINPEDFVPNENPEIKIVNKLRTPSIGDIIIFGLKTDEEVGIFDNVFLGETWEVYRIYQNENNEFILGIHKPELGTFKFIKLTDDIVLYKQIKD